MFAGSRNEAEKLSASKHFVCPGQSLIAGFIINNRLKVLGMLFFFIDRLSVQ